MIYLTKGMALYDNPGLVVYDQTGYYNDGDPIICAPIYAPEEPAVRYEAKYIAYGGMVYATSDQETLLKAVLAIDPKSLFGKDSQAIAVDKMVQAILPNESGKDTGEIIPEQPLPIEDLIMATSSDPIATSTPLSMDSASTTPATTGGAENSTL